MGTLVVSDDFCACVFQGMLVEGPPGPEGPTVSQPVSYSVSLSLSLLTSYLVFALFLSYRSLCAF